MFFLFDNASAHTFGGAKVELLEELGNELLHPLATSFGFEISKSYSPRRKLSRTVSSEGVTEVEYSWVNCIEQKEDYVRR